MKLHRLLLLPVYFTATAFMLTACSTSGPAVQTLEHRPQTLKPVELSNTFVHELPAQDTGRKYQVWVYLPPSYDQSDKPLPVVFTTDPPYAFPLIRSISSLVGARGQNIEPFILIGLAYEPGLPLGASRSRDYTPTNPLLDPTRNPNHYAAPLYGEAATYHDYIERQVFPMIAQNYRADLSRTVYIGQSYGGLFGAYTLVTKPELFQTYLLGSPSLWFDKRAIWPIEAAYASKHKDMKARVKIYTGAYETIKAGPRYPKEFDLLNDMFEFERLLKSRTYPGLDISTEELADEDHRTMGPGFITRGLLWALPGYGPYTGE